MFAESLFFFSSTRSVSPLVDCRHVSLLAYGLPIQSWIIVCEGNKGGGREASLRSRQHYTQVPEGVVPTQLSLPVTCIHQLLSCSCCHQRSSSTPTAVAWPCPGYPCLTPLSHFSHASFCHIMEDPRQFYFPWKRHHFLSHVTRERSRVEVFFVLPIPSYFTLFIFFPFLASSPLQCWTPQVQIHRNRTVLPRIHFSLPQMSIAIEHLFSPAPRPSQTHSSLPLFHSSVARLQLWCPLNYSRDR